VACGAADVVAGGWAGGRIGEAGVLLGWALLGRALAAWPAVGRVPRAGGVRAGGVLDGGGLDGGGPPGRAPAAGAR
jgi:hypothetical protein